MSKDKFIRNRLFLNSKTSQNWRHLPLIDKQVLNFATRIIGRSCPTFNHLKIIFLVILQKKKETEIQSMQQFINVSYTDIMQQKISVIK